MSALPNSNARTIVVMHGDQTGEELLQEALRVLDPGVIGLELDFQHFDLSLKERRDTKNEVVKEAGAEGRHNHATRSQRRGQPKRHAAGRN